MKINLFWFRRDLRLEDNAGLYHALRSGSPVLLIFIFDTEILNRLEDKRDARVEFIHNALKDLHRQLVSHGSSLLILHGSPVDVFKKLIAKYEISEVFTNHDYEPYSIKRDEEVKNLLESSGIKFNPYKDQVIFEKNEVVKPNGKPYTVFTPYSKVWLARLEEDPVKTYPTEKYFNNFYKTPPFDLPELTDIGFNASGIQFPPPEIKKDVIKKYEAQRDYPAIEGTTRLSVHLRFGTVSIRKLVKEAQRLNETWLKELVWREFFMMILYHFPHSAESSFKPEYDMIKWRNDESEFDAWCRGETGYPIVDAGMRQLNATGFMHNRVRMITASFLVKHLLIDWRWGERYFADKLLDYEMSSNVGNWQWAAGTGCDAAPYFRVFNPYIQTEKFDPELKYIKKWVSEYNTPQYPVPIVEHKEARDRALNAYKEALNKTR